MSQNTIIKEDRLKHPQLEINKKEINYDTIFKNSNTTRRITITNSGETPLQIYNVRSSCGLSVPSWPRYSIEQGDSSFIQISYNSSNLGPINRKLIIHSNSPENTKIINVKGFVIPKD